MDDLVTTYVALVRARDRMVRRVETRIRETGLSEPQFNVLRILRGADGPLPTSEIGRRMITRVPDITRLVDRLEAMGLVARQRAPRGDRRQVLVSITPEGLVRIRPLDRSLQATIRDLFADLDPAERETLTGLLDRVAVAD